MDLKLFFTVVSTVFLAELGDKTQLATMLFAAKDDTSRLTVFLAASTALIAASALGVLAGAAVSNAIDPAWLTRIAGIGFIAIGMWTLWQA
ncbi:MAG: TMEM165/GDT1 family protein [Pseudomonadales bacterium]|nr:TMEM165/GDT1 family protein [Pseudomonadales bacterium]